MEHLHRLPHKFIIPFIIFAVLGFLDAAYLTAEHYAGTIPPCSVLNGCETVLTSQYAAVYGVPVALPGALYYLAVLVLVIAYLDAGNPKLLKPAFLLVTVGFAASVGFVFLQVFVIRAFCLYCLFSAATTTALFVLTVVIRRRKMPPTDSAVRAG